MRELRVAGRDHWNKWHRVLAAAAVLFLGWVTRLFDANSDGRQLFATVHLVVFCIIWIFVPLTTADCISKERREGTLGLLFLTPLRAWHVVIAKSLVQASRAAFMWLAAVPVLTLAFLMGGVTKWEVALSVMIHFSSICCAISAGILVSGYVTDWSRSMVFALFVSLVLLIGYLEIQLWVVEQFTGLSKPMLMGQWFWRVDRQWFLGLLLATNWHGDAWQFVTAQGQLYASWLRWMFVPCLASFIFLVLSVMWAGLVVRRSLTSEKSEENSAAVRVGQAVLFPGVHRAWSRRRLEQNPIGWLEQRTWTARTLQWGWLAIIIGLYTVIAGNLSYNGDFGSWQRLIGWGLLAALGMTAAASFRRERENGMLSLLLITPLTPNQIVMGRVRGLWAQIRWATVLFVAGWIFLQGVSEVWFDYYWMFFFAVSYLTLPVTGLFCSLWRKSYFAAVLWTLMLGIIYPLTLALMWAMIVLLLFGFRNFWPTALVVAALVQITIAYVRGRELIGKLEKRSFSF